VLRGRRTAAAAAAAVAAAAAALLVDCPLDEFGGLPRPRPRLLTVVAATTGCCWGDNGVGVDGRSNTAVVVVVVVVDVVVGGTDLAGGMSMELLPSSVVAGAKGRPPLQDGQTVTRGGDPVEQDSLRTSSGWRWSLCGGTAAATEVVVAAAVLAIRLRPLVSSVVLPCEDGTGGDRAAEAREEGSNGSDGGDGGGSGDDFIDDSKLAGIGNMGTT